MLHAVKLVGHGLKETNGNGNGQGLKGTNGNVPFFLIVKQTATWQILCSLGNRGGYFDSEKQDTDKEKNSDERTSPKKASPSDKSRKYTLPVGDTRLTAARAGRLLSPSKMSMTQTANYNAFT